MTRTPVKPDRHPWRKERGYLIVLFVIVVAFVGVVASMQVLVLTSVATTSRAYDGYRQAATEMTRLEHGVTEALLTEAQISVVKSTQTLTAALTAQIANLSAGGATVTATQIPVELPAIMTFPDMLHSPDALAAIPAELQPFMTPELALLVGPRATVYPELQFTFASERLVLEAKRTYQTQVRARLLAVPLTRFPVAAYDLPSEIGETQATLATGPASLLPSGLVPPRDGAFVADLQGQPGVLSYHYRRRAVVAAAYQYLFSQVFVDRVAEYAGVTHYVDLDAGSGTATLNGMIRAGNVASWDLGRAGDGTYGTVTMTKDAAVIFTAHGGNTVRLFDSVGRSGSPALFLVLMGPRETSPGPLTVELGTIARPVVIVGYNIAITATAGTAVNGAIVLDPASSFAPGAPVTLGHLSYWAGSARVAERAVVPGPMALAAETIAPRVVYVATRATRL